MKVAILMIFNDIYMSLLQTKIALNDTRIIVKCVSVAVGIS